MEKAAAENVVLSLKKAIGEELEKQHYKDVLDLVSLCACILYNTNMYYMDAELETTLQEVANKLLEHKMLLIPNEKNSSDAVVFYDGFGVNSRGLAQIYLSALVKSKKVYYITYEKRKDDIPDLLRIVQTHGGEVFFLRDDTELGYIVQLNNIVKKVRAGYFIHYSVPYDVVAPTLMFAYNHIMTRVLIDLNDHAFWLGARSVDICIEFREYGASISKEYRKIPENRIFRLPFYPIIDKNQQFEGFPFELKCDQKVIFSGGSLYKTLGDGNKYYEIVDYILNKHSNVVFWYAGFGDDRELKKVMAKYPNRVFLTGERHDLYQVLRHCYFYLSTYPLCGGLMYQYAACAGKIPVTLRHSSENDGILIDQEKLGIDFDTVEEVKAEIDLLIKDEIYAKNKSQKLCNAVISQKEFECCLQNILNNRFSVYPLQYCHIETEEFRQIYLDNITEMDVNEMFVRRKPIKTIIRHFPLRFFQGGVYKLRKIVFKK